MKYLIAVAALLLSDLAIGQTNEPVYKDLSDTELRRLVVKLSIAQVHQECPCPYNIKANGKECGFNSIYYQTRGARPYCFVEDVPLLVLEHFRETGLLKFN